MTIVKITENEAVLSVQSSSLNWQPSLWSIAPEIGSGLILLCFGIVATSYAAIYALSSVILLATGLMSVAGIAVVLGSFYMRKLASRAD